MSSPSEPERVLGAVSRAAHASLERCFERLSRVFSSGPAEILEGVVQRLGQVLLPVLDWQLGPNLVETRGHHAWRIRVVVWRAVSLRLRFRSWRGPVKLGISSRLVDDWAVVRHPTHIRIMQQQLESCVAALERAIDANPNTQMPPSQPLPPGWGRGAEPRR
jgi:hypothetical protein